MSAPALLCLFEMFEKNALRFVTTCDLMRSVVEGLSRDEPDKGSIASDLRKLARLCSDLKAPYSASFARRVTQALSRETGEVVLALAKELQKGFRAELEERYVLVLSIESARQYGSWNKRFAKETCLRFPEIVRHARGATECLGLEQADACVFHCMGITEVGIRALCLELHANVKLEDRELTWQRMISGLRNQISSRGDKPAPYSLTHPGTWQADELFFTKVIEDIDAVRLAVRNELFHFRSKFDIEEAGTILDKVSDFINLLGTRLSEHSDEAEMIERLRDRDVHPLEKAQILKELMGEVDFTKATPKFDAICRRVGISHSAMYDFARYFKLIPKAKELFRQGKLSASKAREVARLLPDRQRKCLEYLEAKRSCSTRDLVEFIKQSGFNIVAKRERRIVFAKPRSRS